MYHYKTNSILATPIANMDDKSIFEAFKAKFNMLEEKGYKPKVNVMDNQATKYIKQFLTKKGCKQSIRKPANSSKRHHGIHGPKVRPHPPRGCGWHRRCVGR
jgi:hypothetical protein